MEEQNVIENLTPEVQPVQPSKSNKLFILGLVIAISLALLLIFLVLVYFFIPGKKQMVTIVPETTNESAVMSGSDEVVDIDKDLNNTEIPNIESDLLQIEQQVGL